MTPSLDMAEAGLQTAWREIHRAYTAAHYGYDAILTCVYRSPSEQMLLYGMGRTTPGAIVTYCDGVHRVSNHNHFPARALDFCILIHGKVSWEPAEYAVVGMLAEERGLVWGGNWQTLRDCPHLEIKEAP